MKQRLTMLGLAAILIASLIVDARAADLPPSIKNPPPLPYVQVTSNWSGFYVGGTAGYGWGTIDTTNNSMTTSGQLVGIPAGVFTPAATFTGVDSSGSINGATAGGFVGYNYQIGSIVLGVEGDFQWSNFKTASAFAGSPLGPQYTTEVKGDMFGTVRGRLGYAFDNVLIYGTGGAAFGHFKSSLGILPGPAGAPTGPQYAATNDAWLTGYAVGAGIDYKLTSNLILGVEYLHIGYGNRGYDYDFGAAGSAHADAKLDFDMVRARLGYKF